MLNSFQIRVFTICCVDVLNIVDWEEQRLKGLQTLGTHDCTRFYTSNELFACRDSQPLCVWGGVATVAEPTRSVQNGCFACSVLYSALTKRSASSVRNTFSWTEQKTATCCHCVSQCTVGMLTGAFFFVTSQKEIYMQVKPFNESAELCADLFLQGFLHNELMGISYAL